MFFSIYKHLTKTHSCKLKSVNRVSAGCEQLARSDSNVKTSIMAK